MLKFTNRSKLFLGLAFISFLCSILAIFFPYYILEGATIGGFVLKVGEYDELAQFISGITAPFLSICTIVLVYETYRAQKDELEETRKEFVEQNATMRLQRFENTFFQMIHTHADMVSKFVKTRGLPINAGLRGREVIEDASRELKDFIHRNSRVTDETIKEIFVIHFYNDFYQSWESTFNHYFRHMFYIVEFVYFSEWLSKEQKNFYAKLVSAQLSQDEFLLLSCNVMLQNYGYPRFTYLIREYDLLRNFRKDKGLENTVFQKFIENTIEKCHYPFTDRKKPVARNID